ncbi:MAG: SBBP repeat-containing protein [bacterium]
MTNQSSCFVPTFFRSFVIIIFLSFLVSFSFSGQLIYSTFLGGGEGFSIALDNSGNAYTTGYTNSSFFPTTPGAFDTLSNGSSDVFVTKLNSTGTALIYSTYLGGEGEDEGYAITVDGSGCAYVTGYTESNHFPTTPGAFDTSYNGNGDIFITKLKTNGTALVYSTYFGGAKPDNGYGIAVDNSGNIYITGETESHDFPTTPSAFDTSFNGVYRDAYVSKLNANGTGLVYSTYLGGTDDDGCNTIVLDSSGNAFVVGYTLSTDYPTTPGVFRPSNHVAHDAFVTKLNADGTVLIYSTYLTGYHGTYGSDIVIDDSGNSYITGDTQNPYFPTTPGAFDVSLNGLIDAFVTKLNANGTALLYSTYLGGTGDDEGNSIAIDDSGNVYITGYTMSTDFPTTPDAYDTSYCWSSDVFVCKLNAMGTALLYSSYLGGINSEENTGVKIDYFGNAYITGNTYYYPSSPNFPTTPFAFNTSLVAGSNVFVTKMSLNPYFNINSEFTDSNDTNFWYFEKYGDGTGAGTLLLDTTYGFVAIYQNPEEKGKLTQIFSVPSTGWYTAKAKVWTTIADPSKQQKVYLYLQELDEHNQVVASGTQVIQPGSGYFSSAWNPKELAISFYAQGTKLAVQLVAINPANSGEIGSLCIDYIRVTDGVEIPSNAITLINPSFDDETNGWLLEPYGDAPYAGIWTTAWSVLALTQDGGNKGKASQLFSLPTTDQNVYASAWVYGDATSISETQKVYLYLYDYASGYQKVIDSGDMILQPGKWTPGQWHQLQFVFPASIQTNTVQLVGINPTSNSWASLYFDEVEVKQ